jgi:hypothetical protein
MPPEIVISPNDTFITPCLESIASYYQLDVEVKTKINISKPPKMASNVLLIGEKIILFPRF